MEQDLSWELGFAIYKKALEKLFQAVNYINENVLGKEDSDPILNEIIKDGLIHRFVNTMELAWSTVSEYAANQGDNFDGDNGEVVRKAIQLYLIPEGKIWRDMLIHKTSSTYNAETANEIYAKILNDYYPAFLAFQRTMEGKLDGNRESDYEKWIT